MNTSTPQPCRNCGETDRTPSGKCRRCQREYNRKVREARKSDHVCPDCGGPTKGTAYYCPPCGLARRQAAAQQKAESGTPCDKCGATDWEPSSGACRPCKDESIRQRRERRVANQEACAKCGAVEWNAGGSCQNCQRLHAPRRAARPCKRCGSSERYASGPCIPCTLERRRARGESRANETCGVCGAQEWSIYGICRSCQRIRARELAAQKIKERVPCNNCGKCAWTPSGRCLRCDRLSIVKRARKKRLAGQPCPHCGEVAWWPSGKCSVCHTAYAAKYELENPERVRRQRQVAANRRRSRALASGEVYTAADVEQRYSMQKGRCWWCQTNVGNDFHIDHIIPLAKDGGNGPGNICISCPPCNLQKGAKLPIEFAGRLF